MKSSVTKVFRCSSSRTRLLFHARSVGVARRRHRYSGTIAKNLGGDRIKHLWDKFCDKCSLKPQPLTIE